MEDGRDPTGMKDDEMDKALDAWAVREKESAPDLLPPEKLLRMVRAKRRRLSLPTSLRRPVVWAAAAAVLLAAVLYSGFLRQGAPWRARPALEVALVGKRPLPVPEEELLFREPAPVPKRSRKKGPVPLRQALFQLHVPGSEFVESIDLRFPPEETITLESADSYRLILEPAAEGRLFVFQLTSSGTLAKLFPNEACSPLSNPLAGGERVSLPSGSSWFYPGEEPGRERLFLISSTVPLPEMEALYDRYAREGREGRERLAGMLALFERLEESRAGEAVLFAYSFDHR
ncbi:MAG: hypothetical protein ABIH26_13215 [Candidatus Eisenbacteria bacterium]